MKNHTSSTIKGASLRFAAAAAVLLTAACAALAQGPPPGAGAPVGANPRGGTDSQITREAVLRTAEMHSPPEQANKQRLLAGIEQTKQDFKRIQLVRKDMVEDLLAKKPLNFKQVSERAEEVNKRADRLKFYLMPPAPADAKKPEAEKQAEYNEEELKGALVKLCNTIYSFTENEMFRDLNTIDAQKSTKAGADLLSIIELSADIKRSADKLGKAGK